MASEPIDIHTPGLFVDEMQDPKRFRTVRELMHKKIAVCCIAFLALFYFCGIFASVLAPYGLNEQDFTTDGRLQPPSREHLLGTDRLGRDMQTRVLYSARTTVVFTFVIVLTGGIFLGLGLGLLSGYHGGWIDTVIMRVGEVLAGLPPLILMLAITAAFRPRINEWSFWLEDHTFLGEDAKTLVKFGIIAFATVPFAWLGSCRIVRSQVLAIREQNYIMSAESIGANTFRILSRHVLPAVMPLFLVGLTTGMAGIAGAEVALSYIGLGIDEPAASFGNLIGDVNGSRFLEQYPYLFVAGTVPVILFFFAWNLLGDALVDVFDRRHNVNR